MHNSPVCIAQVKNTLGECPLWDEREQVLYWTDITERQVYRLVPDTGTLTRWPVRAEISALALRANAPGFITGGREGFALVDLQTESFDLLATPEIALPANRMNDGKCDPRGRFWCGSIHEVSDPALRQPIAAVYRLDPGQGPDPASVVKKIRSGVKTSNGFAWSPDGKTFYFTDTPTLQILAFDYDLESGDLANERVFATVPSGKGRPDGATVDVEGCLWSAHFAGACITRYAPDGTVLQVIELPVANVTSCCFGGKDLDTLFITTALEDLSDAELRDQPLAGGLFSFKPGVSGMPMNRYAG
ncbi:SMP-30/gluconolactonase/LRE family protein [Kiloniella laminariae]|uniref:SMP-30/gluconolactonase/LRE family protein n=1 Tax=Kiloniella laminariae TaxID=454162 RepID=A0ABT4LDM6_9PROT|nr:SMP-30/gluconolactonase/LRE family protein [Kiloniella laminariae]MCZ4279203.1 SMP-30/gluconolactonase/LRE family protein [Kiloniella laminariae]